jgi:hypothetical protein
MPLLLIERVICGKQACTVILVLLQLKQTKTVMGLPVFLSTAFKSSILKKAESKEFIAPR